MPSAGNSDHWERVQLLFDELVEMAPAARRERLDEVHGDDPALGTAVAALLQASDDAGDFMGLLTADPSDRSAPRSSPEAPSFAEGVEIQAYRIVRLLGRGGMGEVYLAHDQRLDRLVALKFLSPHLSTSREAHERLYREARAVATLDHPNIATVFEIGEDDLGGVFIAMAYYAGRTLKERIAVGPLPLDEALAIAEQVAAGLGAAHDRGVIHRDIKPANILIPDSGPVKILDFGLAKRAGQDLTRSNRTMGTVAYMAPEQIREGVVDHRVDLWALGVVLFEMLSGRPPFQGDHEAALLYAILYHDPPALHAVRPGLPVALTEIVWRALARTPENRYPDAATLRQDLQRLRRSDPEHSDTGTTFPTNLPPHLTELIGREHELKQIKHLVAEKGVRLLTLTGPGGTGKTRLATRLASDLAADFEDGVCFVSLAPITDSALVASAVAHVLGVREMGNISLRENLVAYLRTRHGLLVLDNFEHVPEAAEFVLEVLSSCPFITIVVTSRAPLHLQGEHEYPVPPLPVPGGCDLAPEDMLQWPSVALFVARAQAVKPSFVLDRDNAAAVGEICARLDGLPLAIELAAARVKVLSVRALVARLQHRFDLLEGEGRDRPARHRTLREALAWSYELLSPADQALFRRLGVFVGGCTLEAVEAVCFDAADPAPPALRRLASLIDKSLLRQEEGADGEPRFIMLETIRAYALEQLQATGTEAEVRRAHLAFFRKLAQEAAPELTGPDQVEWLDRLEQEHNDLRAALAFALAEQPEAAADLATALCRFWLARGFASEGYERATATLAASEGDLAPVRRANLLTGAAMLAANVSRFPKALEMLEEALTLLQGQRRPALTGEALNHLSWNLLCMGEHARAHRHAGEAMALYRSAGHERGVSVALNNLGYNAFSQGDFGTASTYFEESLACCRRTGDLRSLMRTLSNLGFVLHHQGRLDEAEALHTQAVATAEATREPYGRFICRNRLTLTHYEQGRDATAVKRLEEMLPRLRTLGHLWGTLENLYFLGYVLQTSGDVAQAEMIYDEYRKQAQHLAAKPWVAQAVCRQGEVRLQQGDPEGAWTRYQESLRLYDAMESKAGIADCLEGLARIALEAQQGPRAVVLLGATEALRAQAQAAILPRRRHEYDAFVRRLRTFVGEDVFSSAQRAAGRMDRRAAAAYGLREGEEVPASSAAPDDRAA